MRGSNESTHAEEGRTDGGRQFVDLPLFTDLEPSAEEAELEAASTDIPEPDETGPIAATVSNEAPVEPPRVETFATEPEPVELDLEAPESVDLLADEPSVEEPIEGPATITNRLGAALLDLAVMASAAVALLGGAALLGTGLGPGDWPAFVVPWLSFSFLYHVVPLAFWGRTPGMASMGITARHLDGGSLSFGLATYRWLATMGTALLLGLPGLLALTGRSACDRASESVTVWQGYRPAA